MHYSTLYAKAWDTILISGELVLYKRTTCTLLDMHNSAMHALYTGLPTIRIPILVKCFASQSTTHVHVHTLHTVPGTAARLITITQTSAPPYQTDDHETRIKPTLQLIYPTS